MAGWCRWALVSPDGVAPSLMVSVSASANLPLPMKSRSSLLAPAHPGGPGKRAVKWLWWWWYNDTVKNSSITTNHLYLILTFWSHHEVFIRRSWYSVLPSLHATISCRIKKVVVGVTQLITALVSIHSSMTFLADMYSFLDPPSGKVLFSVDDRSLFPVDCVIGLIRMVGECWLAIFHQTGCALTSGKSSFGSWTQFPFYVLAALPLTFFQFLLRTFCHSWHKEPGPVRAPGP